MDNKVLSLCIVTCNRAEILSSVLEGILNQAQPLGISVYVSDNGSVDNTPEVLRYFEKRFSVLRTVRSERNEGFDSNVERVLLLPDSKYVWLLGDSIYLAEGALTKIELKLKSLQCAVMAVNSKFRVKNIPSCTFTDPLKFVRLLGWHVTLIGTTIWSREAVSKERFKRYKSTLFVYYGVLMDYLADQPGSIYWESNCILGEGHNKKGPSYWVSEALEVWVSKWALLVMALPVFYDLNEKIRLIKSHKQSGIFRLRHLISFRARGGVSFLALWKVRHFLLTAMGAQILFALLLSLIPRSVVKNIIKCKKVLAKNGVEGN